MILLSLSVVSSAQESTHFNTLTIDDGLSDNSIRCLLQDHHGFIWIGTENGLNRYDGQRMTLFKDNATTTFGIRGNMINCLYEDAHQRLWIGTNKGLHLLHPSDQRFEYIPLLGDDDSGQQVDIVQIVGDSQGTLWLATRLEGMISLSSDEQQQWSTHQYLHHPTDTNSLLTNRIVDIAINKDFEELNSGVGEELLVFTIRGVNTVNTVTGSIRVVPRDAPYAKLYNYEIEVARLLHAAQQSGLTTDSLMNGALKILGPNAVLDYQSVDLPNISYGTGPFPRFITHVSVTNHHVLWAAGLQGLYRLNLVTDQKASFRYERNNQNSLDGSGITCLMTDADDNLWIGTRNGGVQRILSAPSPFAHISVHPATSGDPKGEYASALIMDDDQNLWVRSHRWRLYQLAFNQGSWTNEDTYDRSFRCFTQTLDGNLLLSTMDKKLVTFNPNTSQSITYDVLPGTNRTEYNITVLCQSQNGSIYMATEEQGYGAYRWKLGWPEVEKLCLDPVWANSICDKKITDIYEDDAGQIWVSTDLGLYVFSDTDKMTRVFLEQAGDSLAISSSQINSVNQDKNGGIWISTNDGLNYYDAKSHRVIQLYDIDGLPSNNIFRTIEDQLGHMWVITSSGLARSIAPIHAISSTPSDFRFRTFAQQPGLVNRTFYANAVAHSDLSGQLFVGGSKGITLIEPKRILSNLSSSNLMVAAYFIRSNRSTENNEQKVHFTQGSKRISMDHQDDVLTLQLADLNYKGYDNNQYQYQLEGLSEQWVTVPDNKEIVFLDLEAGDYHLNIRGVTPDNIEISEQSLIDITVTPPWWSSDWARFFYLITFGGMIYFIYRFQLGRQLAKEENLRLKELDQVKTKLYTNVTHEFRTPLTVISGMADQIKGDNEIKNLIKRNSDQLLNLVNQMLDLRKLESSNITFNYIQGDIISFLRYLTESLQSYGEMKGLTIHFLADEPKAVMDYDREKITRIHSNLLSNAIKFTPEGGNIYIQLSKVSKNGGSSLMIKVRDTGIGIPKDKLPHIFKSFYRVDGDMTTDDRATPQSYVSGTGIGLTLVAELVRAMSGDIQVNSTVAQGTTVVMNLPVTNKAPSEDTSISIRDSVNSTIDLPSKLDLIENNKEGNGQQHLPVALIVEDNPDVIHYLISCLQNQYHIEIAMDGKEGIDKGIGIVPDLIVSDVMMPIMDGFSLCEKLKDDIRTSHIPIILLTAKADFESKLEGLERGADAYLSKPFHKEELLITLKNLLKQREMIQAHFRKFDATFSPDIEQDEAIIDDEAFAYLYIEDEFLNRIRTFIELDLSNGDIDMPTLVREIKMSRSQIYKKVKALTGLSPTRYIRSIRLYHAKKMLASSDLNVSEVAYEVGFSSPVYFSDVYLEEFGIRPNETSK